MKDEPMHAVADPVSWHSAIAGRFDARYRTGRMFKERIAVWEVAICSAARAGDTVADLGCGSGIFAVVAAKVARKVIGIDASPEMVELARARVSAEGLSNTTIIQGRLEAFRDSIDGPVDLIICSSVIEYLADPDAFLRNCWTLLRPGGTLLLSVPNGDSWYRRLEAVAYKYLGRPAYRAFVRTVEGGRSAEARLRAAGFEVARSHYFGRVRFLSYMMGKTGQSASIDTMVLYEAMRRR